MSRCYTRASGLVWSTGRLPHVTEVLQSSAVPVEQVKGPMILGSDGCAGSSPYADFEGAEQNHVRVVAGKRLRSFWVLVELLL